MKAQEGASVYNLQFTLSEFYVRMVLTNVVLIIITVLSYSMIYCNVINVGSNKWTHNSKFGLGNFFL